MAGLLLLLAMVGAIALTIDPDASNQSAKLHNAYMSTERLTKSVSYWGSILSNYKK